jgi:hypothetical protein
VKSQDKRVYGIKFRIEGDHNFVWSPFSFNMYNKQHIMEEQKLKSGYP